MPTKKLFSAWFPITVILFISVAVRLPLLNDSFWLDEAAQALESNRPLSQQLFLKDDFQPPFLHVLLHFAMYGSSTEWWLRTVGALVPAIITIYFTYKIGVTVKNKTAGVIASLLLTTSSFHTFYSQELRPYSLPAMFGVTSWYLLLKCWKNQQKPTKLDLVWLAVATTSGLYSSYLYPFLMVSQVVWLIFAMRKNLWSWSVSYIAAAVSFFPWIPFFLEQLRAGTELQASLPGWSRVVSPTQMKAVVLVVAKYIFGVLNVELQPFFIFSLLVIVLSCIVIVFQKKYYVKTWPSLIPLFYWLIVPIATAWLVSFWIPVLQPKRVLFCLPAFYLCIAVIAASEVPKKSLQQIWKKCLHHPAIIIVIVLLVLNIIGTVSYWTHPALQRENWKSLVSELEYKYPHSSVAIVSFPEAFAPWRWYTHSMIATLASGELSLQSGTAELLVKKATSFQYVITFDYLRDLTDPNHLLNATLINYGYKEIEVLDYPVIGFIRIYSKPEAVISYK